MADYEFLAILMKINKLKCVSRDVDDNKTSYMRSRDE